MEGAMIVNTIIMEWLRNPMILYPLLVWSFFWKGWALWRAARLTHLFWFIALLVVNTVGIFEIIYILVTNKKYQETVS